MRLNSKDTKRARRGVALIFALFTIAILFSISTTVVALSMHHRQDSQVMSYNDAALQAANWGLEAAINYMGQPGRKFVPQNVFQSTASQWEVGKPGAGYESFRLKELNYPQATAAGGKVGVNVRTLNATQLAKWGIDYPQNGSWGSLDNRDRWQTGDSRLIQFVPADGGLYPPVYPTVSGAPPYAVVNVVCTEIRTKNQPSTYELVAIANVMQTDDEGHTEYADGNGDPLVTDIPARDQSKILASRAVSTKVRQIMASDFMHFVQNARSWDATGVDLWENSLAQDRVFIPEGYHESGRLRVDGYDGRKNPEGNALKVLLNRLGVDGSLAFLYKDKFETDHYSFPGDVTTLRPAANFITKQIAQDNADKLKGKTAMFTGQLRDATPSLGLPNIDNYFTEVRQKVNNGADGGKKFEFTVGGNGSSYAQDWRSVRNVNGCPDVAQAKIYRKTGEGTWEESGATSPTFATVRVEICANQVRVVKYNAAMTTDGQLLGSQQNSNGSEKSSMSSSDLNPKYVEILEPWTDISRVRNGLISVTGGNVEVVNVATRALSKNGLCEDYVRSDHPKQEGFMKGALTVVANVDAQRDQALGNIQSSSQATPQNGGIYSTKARQHWEKNPYVNVPPFSQYELYGSGSRTKNIWPSPANSTIEREGNIIIGSDILQNGGTNAAHQALGVVAKNFVYLNDKNAYGADTGKWSTDGSLNELRVDAVLMSMDHSVQMDWNNLGGNKYHDRLLVKRRGYKTQDTTKDPTNSTMRRFTLNGAIVSGFMDVEGDSTGAGYFDQKFSHDPNLLYNLPPFFPKWSLTEVSQEGCFMDFLSLEYKDHGAINNLGYE